jgi:hypothetical protein
MCMCPVKSNYLLWSFLCELPPWHLQPILIEFEIHEQIGSFLIIYDRCMAMYNTIKADCQRKGLKADCRNKGWHQREDLILNLEVPPRGPEMPAIQCPTEGCTRRGTSDQLCTRYDPRNKPWASTSSKSKVTKVIVWRCNYVNATTLEGDDRVL